MPRPEADLHLRLDLLHGRPSAVTATITGTPTHIVLALLALHGFEPLDDKTMVMARIDREEAHYAEQAARALRAEGITDDAVFSEGASSEEALARADFNTSWGQPSLARWMEGAASGTWRATPAPEHVTVGQRP
ncbi:hypothetical protein [Streptomyces arenae]|uniref:hypothetical protein n=1 Tax=Streptomyces arenae TaxID=29301 RepID=UPI00265B5C3E|nr:hypothetical protein [Streptomyces arenae]MCG7207278.1 hypothetical protein [Streptomyces arenae]